MPNRIILYPYKMGSESGRRLQQALAAAGERRVLRVRRDGRYRPYRNHLIVNWGSGLSPGWRYSGTPRNPVIVNDPSKVRLAAHKLAAFQEMLEANVPIPEFTTDSAVAADWARAGAIVVVRHILNGSGGEGIELIQPSDNPIIPRAPLYTKYFKKRHEYRVHVFNGRVIDVQQKRKRRGSEYENGYVRNARNGWVFTRDNIVPIHDTALGAAIAAVGALGLDFGAVDIGWNEKFQRPCVFEVNTAPGLQGTTLQKYVNEIKRLAQ